MARALDTPALRLGFCAVLEVDAYHVCIKGQHRGILSRSARVVAISSTRSSLAAAQGWLQTQSHNKFPSVNKAIPLIALQECGPWSALHFKTKLGADWEFFAAGTEDPVATFWDRKVALRLG